MNYNKADLREVLAGQYVLGTLRGRARRRFERLMTQYQGYREAVWLWESHLGELAHKLAPEQAPDATWNHIEQRLFGESSVPTVTDTDNVVAIASARPWQWLSGLALAASLVLAVLVVTPDSAPPQAQYISVFTADNNQPLWLLEVSGNTIKVRSTTFLQTRDDRDYELWMVANDGRAPISLGLLPERGDLTLVAPEAFQIADISALAVSLEPTGGSTNGAPTDVLFTAPVATI